jgi:hypothetical protein
MFCTNKNLPYSLELWYQNQCFQCSTQTENQSVSFNHPVFYHSNNSLYIHSSAIISYSSNRLSMYHAA